MQISLSNDLKNLTCNLNVNAHVHVIHFKSYSGNNKNNMAVTNNDFSQMKLY